jgi:hypothetical protein
MSKITKLYPAGAAKDPDVILERSIGAFQDILILGWNKEGFLEIRSNTTVDSREALYLIELFKHNLLSGSYSEE